MKFIIIIFVVLVLWTLWGVYSSNVEQAPYTVFEERDGYEIRTYDEHIVAETVVTGTYDEALNTGFRIIAGYIFGENESQKKIAMTTPVLEGETMSEKIAMTAPVIAELGTEKRTIAFVMPKEFTMETLPKPLDDRIKIRQVPEQVVAALDFGWPRNENRVEQKKVALLELLVRDGVTPVGSPMYAGYNDPWTPPWMQRNEILFVISDFQQ